MTNRQQSSAATPILIAFQSFRKEQDNIQVCNTLSNEQLVLTHISHILYLSLQMSSNIIANTNANDPAGQRALK
jgi:hypothetical protein